MSKTTNGRFVQRLLCERLGAILYENAAIEAAGTLQGLPGN